MARCHCRATAVPRIWPSHAHSPRAQSCRSVFRTGDSPAYGGSRPGQPGREAPGIAPYPGNISFPRQVILRDYYPMAPRGLPAFTAGLSKWPRRGWFSRAGGDAERMPRAPEGGGGGPGGGPGRPGTASGLPKRAPCHAGRTRPPRLGMTRALRRVAASAALLGLRSRGYPAAVPGRLSLRPFLRRISGQGKRRAGRIPHLDRSRVSHSWAAPHGRTAPPGPAAPPGPRHAGPGEAR